MKAFIQSWNLYGKDSEYPVLVLHCSKGEIEETQALCRLHTICKGLRGFGYQNSLAAINNPDALKDQGTNFVIDLGTVLTLLAEVASGKTEKELAVGWLRSIAASHIQHTDQKTINAELQCRCGQEFSNDKKLKRHQKLCSVMAKDFGLLLRVKESLKALEPPKKGKAGHGNKTEKNSRVQQDTKTHELQPKVPARQKRKPKRKKLSARR